MKDRPVPVTIPGHEGLKLSGLFHSSEGSNRGGVLLAHCFTCSKDFKVLAWLAKSLASRGFAVLRFDFAGLGASEGDFGNTTLSKDVEDLVSAGEWIESLGIPLRVLAGHSLGGAAAMLAAERFAAARVVAVLGTSVAPSKLTAILNEQNWDELSSVGITSVSVAGRQFPMGRDFVSDLDKHDLERVVSSWDKALFMCHGTEDHVVSVEAAQQLFAVAKHPKLFLSLAGSGHLFSESRTQMDKVAEVLSSWLELNGVVNEKRRDF